MGFTARGGDVGATLFLPLLVHHHLLHQLVDRAALPVGGEPLTKLENEQTP